MFKQLTHCTIAITAFVTISFGQNSPVKRRKASILYCDSATLKSYHAKIIHDKLKYDSGFNNMLFHIINEFNGRPLDTTIVTAGKFDEKGNICKINTRVYLFCDTVFVDSKLYEKNRLLWQYVFKEGWMPEGYRCNPIFLDSVPNNSWIYFTCGVYAGPPEFLDYKNNGPRILEGFPSDGKMVIDNDLSDSKNKGINIPEKQFRTYLKNFKGDLLLYGDLVHREQLFIWYSPAKCFILFYAP